MLRRYTLLLASLLAFSTIAMAQSSSTSSAPPTIHTVDVGKGNFMYEPNETYAKPGDIVTFNFYPTNHSVVRAAYGLPCIPYEETGPNLTGFASGNFLVNDLINPPSWNLTINDTQPVFYYCTAIDSCIKEGMVGVINPNASVSLQDQYQQALDSPYMLTPGQPFPNEGEGGSASPTQPHLTANPTLLGSTPTGDASATAGAAPASSSAAAQSSGGSHLSSGAIAGIAVAAVAFIALLAGFFWLLGHRRGFGSATNANHSAMGKGNDDRTEAWAAASSNGTPWEGSQAGYGRGSEMYQKGMWDAQNNQAVFNGGPGRDQTASPQPSPGFMHPMSSPVPGSPGMHHPHNSMATAYFPQQTQPMELGHGQKGPMELGNNEVTELEAPHVVKQ